MNKCRSCFSTNLISVIPLGQLPLANALLSKPIQRAELTYNLEVIICKKCNLAQLRDLVDPKELFSEYVYFSSNSNAMLHIASELVSRIMPMLPENALVIEIASNDGYLLKNYVAKGMKVLGIDPAKNIAKFANSKGIPTLCAFFDEKLAKKLKEEGKIADVIHANNVMAHVPDINGFIRGLKILLKETGTAVIEVPHFLELVRNLEFDTIYHEHVYYFSLCALKPAFERRGLEIYNVEKLHLHGGSLRLFIGHKDRQEVQPIVGKVLDEEHGSELFKQMVYKEFMRKVAGLKYTLRAKLNELKSQGASIAAYGASAKGTTLLNYFGIGKEHIEFVVDRSPVKQGMYTPGTQLKILDPKYLIENKMTHALLLSWNFAEEIMEQQREFLNSGGRFIIPLPEVKVLP